MFKKNLVNKNVIKAMTIGISAALTVMAPMTDIMAVSALADTDPDPGNNTPQNLTTSTEAATKAAEEASKANEEVTNASEAAANAATEQAKIANENVKATTDVARNEAVTNVKNDANKSIEEANKAITAADNAITDAKASNAATEDAAAAGVSESAEAQNKIYEEWQNLDKMQKEFNSGKAVIEADSKAAKEKVDATIVDDGKGNTDVLIKDDQGNTVKATEEIKNQEADAKEALTKAQELLDEALKDKTRDEDKLVGLCGQIADEAAKAVEAQTKAQAILDAEIKQYNELIKSYNTILVKYGLAGADNVNLAKSYDGTSVILTADEIAALEAAKLDPANLDKILKTMQDYKLNNITDLYQEILDAESNVANAKESADAAVDAAKSAIKSAKAAVDSANTAIDEAQAKVAEYNQANEDEYKAERDAKVKNIEKITTDNAEGAVLVKDGDYVKVEAKEGARTVTDGRKGSDITEGNKRTVVKFSEANAAGGFVFQKIDDKLKLVWVEKADVTKTTTVIESMSGSKQGLTLDNSANMTEEEAKAKAKELAETETKPTDLDGISDYELTVSDVEKKEDEYSQDVTYLESYKVSGGGTKSASSYNSELEAYQKYFSDQGYLNATKNADGTWNAVKDGKNVVIELYSNSLKSSSDNEPYVQHYGGDNSRGNEKYYHDSRSNTSTNPQNNSLYVEYEEPNNVGKTVWRYYIDDFHWYQYEGESDTKWVWDGPFWEHKEAYYTIYYCSAQTGTNVKYTVSGPLNANISEEKSTTITGTAKDANGNVTNLTSGSLPDNIKSRGTASCTKAHYVYSYEYSYKKTTTNTDDLGNQVIANTVFGTSMYPAYDKPDDSYAADKLSYDKKAPEYVNVSNKQGSIDRFKSTAAADKERIENIVTEELKETFKCEQTVLNTKTLLETALTNASSNITAAKTHLEVIDRYVEQASNIELWGNFLYNGTSFGYAITDGEDIVKANVEVPYSIVRAYVEQEAGNKQNIEEFGPDFYEEGFLDLDGDNVYYWEIGPNGEPTGKAYTLAELPTTPGSYSYIKGTTFTKTLEKPNLDAPRLLLMASPKRAPKLYYILGGELYTYKIDPPYNPGGDPTGDDPTGDLPTGGTITPAAAPVAAPQAEVLGARRSEGGSVLGAKRGLDQAVLGKKRSPETGDSMAVFGWFTSLMASLGGTGVAAGALKKNKKKEDAAE